MPASGTRFGMLVTALALVCAGADADDLSTPKTDPQIVTKFRGLTEEYLGAKRVKSILDRLWALERHGERGGSAASVRNGLRRATPRTNEPVTTT
jgi:hypothetical protein